MSPRLSTREISQRLADDFERLVRELLGEPDRSLSKRDALRFGTHGSLSVVLAGRKRGKWYDHEAGEGGDAFGLVQRVIGKPGAREWALRWLGIDEAPARFRLRLPSGAAPAVLPAAEEREDAVCAPPGSPLVSEEPAAEDEPADLAKAAGEVQCGFLRRCVAASEGTATAFYLRRRGYSGPIPAVLLSAAYGCQPDIGLPYYEDGVRMGDVPAMVAEIAQPDAAVAGVHVTYLRPDGSGKADVPSPKKMHGVKKGGAVRLTPAGPVLAVTEGIETALSILEARPDLAVWAALDAGNMKALDLPAEVRKVLVCADNDASGAGLNAAHAAADRWLAEGREVAIALPPEPGTDFNDVLLNDGAAAIRALLDRAEPFHGSESFVPHFAAEPMTVEAASAALVEAVDGFVEAEAIHVQVRRAQAAAVRDALAARPELDPAVTVSALISPIAERAHKQLVGRAKSRARRAVLAEHGLTRLPERERLQVAAGAGIGKTQAVIEAVAARRTVPFVVHYYVPTHALSDGLAERFRQAGVRAHVIRGRTAAGPDGKTMCRTPKLAEKLGAAGLNVKKSICKNKRGPCDHYGRCPYMLQVEEITTGDAATVIIMPHSYLTQPKPEGLPAADFAVIDESPVQSLLAKATVAAEELDAPEHWSVPDGETGALADFLETGRMLRAALKGRSGTIGKADAGLPPLSEIEQAAAFAGEFAGASSVELSPSMDEQEALRMLSKLKPSPRGSIARLYRVLAFEMALERDLLHGIEGSGNEVRLHWRRKPKPGAEAVLIIDADADESIGRVLWGERLRHLSLPVRRNAIVTQVTDATFSKSSLIDLGWQSEKARKTAARKLEEVRRLVRDLVALHGPSRVLVVANKPVRFALTREDPAGKLPAATDYLGGAAIANFGNVRGIDTWKDCTCAVIIGREQLPAEAAEGEARALYWDDPDPLNLSGAFRAERRGYRLATRRRAGAEVWVHPDPRVQRLHELRREREVGQAIDRLRLVHREEPAHVYLLGSLPVDVTVDRLVETDDLLREVAIQAALKRHGGVLPLTPEWLLEHEPLALVPGTRGEKPGKTALGAAIARLARDAEARSLAEPTAETGCSPSCLPVSPITIFIGDTGRHSGESALPRPWSLLQYRERGSRGGKPRSALAVHDHADPAAALSALLGREVALVPEVRPASAPPVPVGIVLPFARVSGWEPAARSAIAVRHRMSFPELAVWDAQGRRAGWHFGLPLPAGYWSQANGHDASAA